MNKKPRPRWVIIDVNSERIIEGMIDRLEDAYPGHLTRNRKLANSILATIRVTAEDEWQPH